MKKENNPAAADHDALHVVLLGDVGEAVVEVSEALKRVDIDYPDRPHPYPLPDYPQGETMTQFKRRRAKARAAGRAGMAPPKAKAFVAATDCPPALKQLVKNKILEARELRGAACLARDYDLGYRSSIRTTAYEERVGSGGGGHGGAERVAVHVLDARARYDSVKAAIDARLWVYVFAVVIERVERVNVSGVADRYSNPKARRAASAVALVTGLAGVADWYAENGWGGRV